MKTFRKFLAISIFLGISLMAFAVAMPNQCDNPEVAMPVEHGIAFWGKRTVATYNYTDTDGCVYAVSCVTTYRLLINFGTEAVRSAEPAYCN